MYYNENSRNGFDTKHYIIVINQFLDIFLKK